MQLYSRISANSLVKPTKNEPCRGGHGSPGEFEDAEATVPLAVPCGLAPGPRSGTISGASLLGAMGANPEGLPPGDTLSRGVCGGVSVSISPPSSLGHVLPQMAHQMLGVLS